MDGTIINRRYRIDREIGVGGMARVYLGHDLLLDRTVAVKRLHQTLAGETTSRARFARETQAAANLTHPHIVDIYDVGEQDDQLFVVMQYVAGATLANLIEHEGPFHPDDVAALVEQVATALDFAHDRGIVHRDVKPTNILVDEHGIAKVVDFGIVDGLAEGTGSGRVIDVGTAGYMAPEQALGDDASPASDIYSLGVVAYEMLTKELPFQAGTADALMLRHIEHDPAPPSRLVAAIPQEIDAIILKALAKEPRQRFGTAGEFSEALTEWRRLREGSARAAGVEHTQALPAMSAPASTIAVELSSQGERPARENVPVVQSPVPPRRRGPLANTTTTWLVGLIGLVVTVGVVLAGATLSPRVAALFEEDPPATERPAGGGETGANESPTEVETRDTAASTGSIPDLTGLSVNDARALLAAEGVELREDPAIFSETIRSGAIAEQDPPPSSPMTAGGSVFVKTSRGPAQVDLTELAFTGQSADSVQQRLSELGIAVRREERGSVTVPAGNVVELVPATDVRPGETVVLVVSRGDQVQIPREIFGAQVSQGTENLQILGLAPSQAIGVDRATIEQQIDLAAMGIEPGDIVGIQNESSTANFGAWLDRGSPITLVFYDSSLDNPPS